MVQSWRWIPNALTLLRIVLVAPFSVALWTGDYRVALSIFIVAAVTDGVDGYLARKFEWRTRLGAIADPLADKALLISAYFMLTVTGVLPYWLFWLVLGRDLLIVCGGLAYHYCVGRFDMEPSLPGKLNTMVQVLVALVVILAQAGLPMPGLVAEIGALLVAASALFSGGHYVILWGFRAWRTKQQ